MFSLDKLNELKLRLQLMETKPFIIGIQEDKPKNFRYEELLQNIIQMAMKFCVLILVGKIQEGD